MIYKYIENVQHKIAYVFFIKVYHLRPIYVTNDNDNKMWISSATKHS